MKNRYQQFLNQLLSDRNSGTKISLYIPVRGDSPAHVIFSLLRDSALRLIQDEDLANDFRSWIQAIREEKQYPRRTRTVACFFSSSLQKVTYLDHEIPPRVVVAQSWHMKPLLYTASTRARGHILEFHSSGISVIRSDGVSHELVETIVPGEAVTLPSKFWPEEIDRSVLRKLISKAASYIPEGTLVQVSGAPEGFARSPKYWQQFWSNVLVDGKSLGERSLDQILSDFDQALSLQKKDLAPVDILSEISGALVISDPVLITQRILQGKVGRIFISLEAIQWGEINLNTGSIKRNRHQQNHIDEDVLDDIAELALNKGIEVRVLRQNAFPGNLEILAV